MYKFIGFWKDGIFVAAQCIFLKILLDFSYKNKKNEDKIPASEDRP